MNRPLVSVVIETVTAREDGAAGPLADDLAATLDALGRQTYPQELIEPIVVIDGEVADADAAELRRRYPLVKFVNSPASNYFAAKNAGASAAAGDIVALLDSDCVPQAGWLEALLAPFVPGVAAVGGRTRYAGGSWTALTFSIPDFAYTLAEENGVASGFVINNVAFRREVLLAHPFEARIRRDGGCYLLFHQLSAEGARVLTEPRAVVEHALDVRGLGFARKHFKRGYDGVTVYRLDGGGVLRGTRLFRRLGPAALVPITGRRIVIDWLRLLRHRRQLGVPAVAVPYFGAVAVVTRLIELAGGLASVVTPGSPSPES
ncbi:MAG: glycosyltransferase [Acidobacteria bacterium]|nr:glycosyltransferase [Acidobacteriota bacterium]